MKDPADMTLAMIEFELRIIADQVGDPEIIHDRADSLLCAALRQLGGSDIADAFDEARKEFWYA